MAEVGEFVPVNTGSDMAYDFYCELCIEDGRQIEAEGYCEDCGEYLCGSCYGGHRKSRPTRHHVLQDKDSMPKDTPLAQDRVNKDIATKCKIHKGEPLKYFCASHNDLGCVSCFMKGHRGCKRIENIMDVSENIFESREYQTFISKVQYMRNLSRDIKTRAHDNQSVSRRCHDDVVWAVRSQKEKAITCLHEMEDTIVNLADIIKSDDEEKMASVVELSDVMSGKIERMSSEFERLQSSKRVCQLYITMKEKDPVVTALQQSLLQLGETNFVRTFTFEPNVNTIPSLNNPDVLGKISYQVEHDRETDRESSPCPSSEIETSLADMNVKSPADKKVPYISGMAVLSSTKLVIADWSNKKVKLIDTNTDRIMDELKLFFRPNDIAKISNKQIVVTLQEHNSLLFAKITDAFAKYRDIPVGGACKGVAFCHDKLFVTFWHDPRLEILDLCGNWIKTLKYNSDGGNLFYTPSYVCISQDGATIYVSDETSYTVTCLTFDGDVKAVYKDGDLLVPQQVCTDHKGRVYVCGGDSSNIHIITADCRKVNVIPVTDEDEAGYAHVNAVSLCQETNMLFVGMWSDTIKFYQL